MPMPRYATESDMNLLKDSPLQMLQVAQLAAVLYPSEFAASPHGAVIAAVNLAIDLIEAAQSQIRTRGYKVGDGHDQRWDAHDVQVSTASVPMSRSPPESVKSDGRLLFSQRRDITVALASEAIKAVGVEDDNPIPYTLLLERVTNALASSMQRMGATLVRQ